MADEKSQPQPPKQDQQTAAIAEAIRKATKTPAELRLEERQAHQRRLDDAARVTTLVPIDEDSVQDFVKADDHLARTQQEMLEAAKKRDEAEAKLYRFFVKCRYTHGKDAQGRPLPNHGIYLTRNPGSTLVRMNEWYSRYKPKPTDVYIGRIVCQVCLQHFQVERELDVDMVGNRGEFRVRPRWLWRRPNDAPRLRAEGEVRAVDVAISGSNQGRQEAADRAREAGLEVIP